MDPHFWHQRWQRDEIGFHQGAYNTQLTRFWARVGAHPDSRVFVPLCGKTRDMLWLRNRGHPVLGVEVSPLAVAAFFNENGIAPCIDTIGAFRRYAGDGITLYCGDFFALSSADLHDIGAVYDRASLIALPPAMRIDYARHLMGILPADTPLLLVTLEYPEEEMAGPPFAVHETEVNSLYADRYRVTLLGRQDLLGGPGQEGERWRSRGLTHMVEAAYLLRPR